MFSASKASQVNDCSMLPNVSRCIHARENMECVLSLTLFSGICFLGYWGGGGAERFSANGYGA